MVTWEELQDIKAGSREEKLEHLKDGRNPGGRGGFHDDQEEKPEKQPPSLEEELEDLPEELAERLNWTNFRRRF